MEEFGRVDLKLPSVSKMTETTGFGFSIGEVFIGGISVGKIFIGRIFIGGIFIRKIFIGRIFIGGISVGKIFIGGISILLFCQALWANSSSPVFRGDLPSQSLHGTSQTPRADPSPALRDKSQSLWGHSPSVVRSNNAAAELLERALEEKVKVQREENILSAVLKPVLDVYEGLKDFFKGDSGKKGETIQQLPPESSMSSEEDGLSSLTRTESYAAYRHLLKAIERESFDSRLYLNLGLALEFDGELDKSFFAYESAQKYSGGDPEIDFLSLYNAARIRGQQGQVTEALRLYQGALEILPHSVEVKTNIELLTAKSQKSKGDGDPRSGGKGDGSDSRGDDKRRDRPYQNGKEQSRLFESRELSEDDVRKILEEIKNQEQKIRAKEHKSAKEKPHAKDW